jgi:23S rRNA (uracil1939-C5)-methyltransferase
MAKDAPLICDIVDLIHDGRGVGRVDGKTCFIDGALPGETVEFRRHNQKRNYDEGHVLRVITPAPNRIDPLCKHFPRCGGCTLQHFDHGAQIAFKQQQLLDSLQHSGIQPDIILPALSAPEWSYRRRARLAVQRAKDGNVLVGFHNPGSRRIEPISHCHVLAQPLADIVPSLPDWLTAFPPGIRLFEIELLSADNAVAIAVEASRAPSAIELQAILAAIPAPKGAPQLWWKSANQSTFIRIDGGTEPLHIQLTDNVDGAGAIQLQVQPGQFVQVNGQINGQMIDQVLSLLRKKPQTDPNAEKNSLAVDLFCGTGNFSLPLAAHFDKVIGIEGLEELVRSAQENAQRNDLTNIEFMVSDLSDWAGMRKVKEKIDLVLLDPPRNGAAGVMPWVIKTKAAQVIYISCHPSTMVRDAKLLIDAGYRLSATGVMDMFPHTAHVEAIALFEK